MSGKRLLTRQSASEWLKKLKRSGLQTRLRKRSDWLTRQSASEWLKKLKRSGLQTRLRKRSDWLLKLKE